MTAIDWIILVGTLLGIALYGLYKTRGASDIGEYFRGGNELRWPTVGLSIMATQASAITFLSMPGQAYEDGLRFVQFYFGLPLAMIVISAVFVPIYFRLKVYTAYEYLEHRFDVRLRYLGALLFLIQRGLAAGITIYAPSIILSTLMGWSLQATNLGIGICVILYTVMGGTKAVAQTQKQQMMVMLGGMVLAVVLVVLRLPDHVSVGRAFQLAGALGKMNAVSFELDSSTRYTFWSGITGGFFLALSYFGTDQSQVQRYLSGRSVAESRLGLVLNGMLKVPMQLVILMSGVMVFVFYLFTQPPIFFNEPALKRALATEHSAALQALDARYDAAFAVQKQAADAYVAALDAGGNGEPERTALEAAAGHIGELRNSAKTLVKTAVPSAETKDSDYIFLTFVLDYVPNGLIGLLIAVIFCAAMSSTASELAALGATTTLDLYRRMRKQDPSPERDVLISKLFTGLWGLVAVGFASFASLLDNMIEAVNILGSIFYGTVLGIFLVAFFVRRVQATAVLIAALVAQATVITLFFATDIGFLWFNVIGSAVVVVLALLVQLFVPADSTKSAA
jgi:Na+/proline symporter